MNNDNKTDIIDQGYAYTNICPNCKNNSDDSCKWRDDKSCSGKWSIFTAPIFGAHYKRKDMVSLASWTLQELCEAITEETNHDWTYPLHVMVRTNGPDKPITDPDDVLLGYCDIERTKTGYHIFNDEENIYSLSDRIDAVCYKPDWFDGLVVWQKGEWISG